MKKSFKDSPAMRFISAPHQAGGTTTPALAEGEGPAVPTVPMKRNPFYIETKSKRLQLLIQPSLYGKLKGRATAQGVSLNELIHTALQKYAEREG